MTGGEVDDARAGKIDSFTVNFDGVQGAVIGDDEFFGEIVSVAVDQSVGVVGINVAANGGFGGVKNDAVGIDNTDVADVIYELVVENEIAFGIDGDGGGSSLPTIGG